MNVKIINLKESAYKYYKDLNEIKDTIEICNKIIRDKNYNILFDDSIINFNGDILKGKIITLENQEIEIKINPNFNHVSTIIHELTHAIETKELKKLVLDYVNKHKEYNSYKLDDASEALANISEKFLGNKEFINTLSLECPNISKRIYNIIISLRNKITFNYKEKYFLKELKIKFRNAYRTENNNLNDNKYSILINTLGKYVKADRQVIIGNNPLEWEKQVGKYINDSIRKGKDVNIFTDNGEILTITSDTAGKAKFRNNYIDKNGNTHYIDNNKFYTKLLVEVHIDELAQISKK